MIPSVVAESIGVRMPSVEPAPSTAEGRGVGRALGIPLGKDVGGMVGKGLGGVLDGEEVGTAVGDTDTLRKIVELVVGKTMLLKPMGKDVVNMADLSRSK